MSLSLLARRARLLALRALIDAPAGGSVALYGGTQPPDADTSAPGAPLCIVALAVPSFELHPTAASMALVPAVGFAAQSGQPTWARFFNGDGFAVYDSPVGLPGSGAPLIVTDGKVPAGTLFFVGGEINLALTMTEPA